MKVKGIRHVGIETDNMKEMIRFYRDILGLELYWDRLEKPEHTGFREDVPEFMIEPAPGIRPNLVNAAQRHLRQPLNVPRILRLARGAAPCQ